LGVKIAQGLTITSAWYRDKDDASRAFAKRIMAKNPNGLQAGIYTEVAFYLNAGRRDRRRRQGRRADAQNENQ
jgi:branched-chain amino acid transport system substrate-binding protein